MTVEVSQLIAEAVAAGQSNPDILVAGAEGAKGNDGFPWDRPANNGAPGDPASCHWFTGCRHASIGGTGGLGASGGVGPNGHDGGNALPANILIGTLQGTVYVAGHGGDGGDGGNGGRGANGGDGGRGGNGDKSGAYSSRGGDGGKGGDGGVGGDGGNGGSGGNGSTISITCGVLSDQSQFVPLAVPSQPGAGGQGGRGGAAGNGGQGGTRGGWPGLNGQPGKDGSPGSDGRRGGKPSVFHIKQGAVTPVTGKDIRVTDVYAVTDTDRTFNTVEIAPGGMLSIQTQAEVRINTLIKSAAPAARKSRSKGTGSGKKSAGASSKKAGAKKGKK